MPSGLVSALQPLLDDLRARHSEVLAETSEPQVHAFRGAARRLLAVVELHAILAPRAETRWLRRNLRRIIRDLSHLRDLDVFIARMRLAPYALETRSEDVWLGEALLARQAEVGPVVQRLRSARIALLLGGLDAWLATLAAKVEPELSWRSCVGTQLGPMHDRVVKAGSDAIAGGVRRRHRLRLKVKRLRDDAEAFVRVTGAEGGGAYLTVLTDLSQALGELNDEVVATRLAASFCPDLATSRQKFGGHPPARDRLTDAWRAFTTTPAVWADRATTP